MRVGHRVHDLESREGSEGCGRKLPSKGTMLVWLIQFLAVGSVVVAAGICFHREMKAMKEELRTLRDELCMGSETGCVLTKSSEKKMQKRSLEEEETMLHGSDIQSAHLEGSFPFQHVHTQGKIGPWHLAATPETFLRLRARSTEVEVLQTGLYYVYAQVYYLTSSPHNSYQLMSYNGTEGRRHHRVVATCSAQGAEAMGETSCYTGMVLSLRPGQRLYLNQVEQDRIVQFTNGCSYLGVIMLKKNVGLERRH